MRRPLTAVAGLAASLSVVSLVLAEKTTTEQGHGVAVVFLFIGFLAAIFTLLAVAIITSDHDVERLSELHEVSPRWSVRAARRRFSERLARVTRNGLTRVAHASRQGVTAVAHASRQGVRAVAHAARAGVRELRRTLDPEQRQATRALLKEKWWAALVVMGMPPKELEAQSPPLSVPASGAEGTQPAGGGIAQLGIALAARYRGTVRRGDTGPAGRRRALRRSRPAGRSPGGRLPRARAWGSRFSAMASVPGRRPLGGDPST